MDRLDNQYVNLLGLVSMLTFHALALVDFGREKHPCRSESEAVVSTHMSYREVAKVGRN